MLNTESIRFSKQVNDFYDYVSTFAKLEKGYNDNLERLTSYRFNFFKYLVINENVISDIIAELLDINGEHGQKELFLNLFLQSVSIPPICNPPFLVGREVRTKQYILNLRRMDILVDWGNFGIMIENKPNDDDQDNL